MDGAAARAFERRPPLWWHGYGAVGNTEFGDDVWVFVCLGESTMSPEDPAMPRELSWAWSLDLPYLRSWAHNPSELEQAAVRPEAYCDGFEVAAIQHEPRVELL